MCSIPLNCDFQSSEGSFETLAGRRFQGASWQGGEAPPCSRVTEDETMKWMTTGLNETGHWWIMMRMVIQYIIYWMIELIYLPALNKHVAVHCCSSQFIAVQWSLAGSWVALTPPEAIYSRLYAVHRCVTRHQQKRSGKPIQQLMLTAGLPAVESVQGNHEKWWKV